MEKKDSNKLKTLTKDLSSGNEKKILTALNALKVNGDVSVITPILEVLKSKVSEKVDKQVVAFLGDLKDTSVKVPIIEALKDDSNIAIRQVLLTTIWNSKIDYSEFISDFVEIACDGNFVEAFECLTILENLEGPFEERHVLECQLLLKDYFEDSTLAKDQQKLHLISDIATLLKAFDLDARTKLIDALGDAPNEIKSTNFERLNSFGLLVAKTIFKIYSEILESI